MRQTCHNLTYNYGASAEKSYLFLECHYLGDSLDILIFHHFLLRLRLLRGTNTSFPLSSIHFCEHTKSFRSLS